MARIRKKHRKSASRTMLLTFPRKSADGQQETSTTVQIIFVRRRRRGKISQLLETAPKQDLGHLIEDLIEK